MPMFDRMSYDGLAIVSSKIEVSPFDERNQRSIVYLGKNKEWSAHNPLLAFSYVSDGFLLNLNLILLNLARPFAEPYSSKLLKINPLYAVSRNENVHLKGKSVDLVRISPLCSIVDLHKETPMIVRQEEPSDETTAQLTFNFITEIFFMTHLSYSCSSHRLHRMLLKVSVFLRISTEQFSFAIDQ